MELILIILGALIFGPFLLYMAITLTVLVVTIVVTTVATILDVIWSIFK